MKKFGTAVLGIAVLLTVPAVNEANAQRPKVERKCKNATCGQMEYWGVKSVSQ